MLLLCLWPAECQSPNYVIFLCNPDRCKSTFTMPTWKTSGRILSSTPSPGSRSRGDRMLHAGVLLITCLTEGTPGEDGLCCGAHDAFFFEAIATQKKLLPVVTEYLEDTGYTSVIIIRGFQDPMENTCMRSARFMNEVIVCRKIPKCSKFSEIQFLWLLLQKEWKLLDCSRWLPFIQKLTQRIWNKY